MDNYDNMIMINMVSKFDVCFPYHRRYLSVQKAQPYDKMHSWLYKSIIQHRNQIVAHEKVFF